MILAKFKANKETGALTLSMSGHSTQAPHGRDLICASASTLAVTCAQCMQIMYSEEKLRKKPHVILNDGRALITVVPKKEHTAEALLYLFSAQVGLFLLARSYPEFVKLISFDKSIQDFSIKESSALRTD